MQPPARLRAARERVSFSSRAPRSLLLLLAIVGVAGVAWALVVPPWQSPDEVAHFAYVQSIAEGPHLPGTKGKPEISDDQNVADNSVGASRGAFYPASAPPSWSPSEERAYLHAERGPDPPSRTDGGGPNPASANPPIYYLFASAGYLIDDGGTAFGRLYTTRIWQVLLILATALGAWLLAGETFGRQRPAQLATAAFAGLLPMDVFDTVSINPDALMIPLWTFALWLGARVINRRGRTGDALALCAVTALAILTKATSYALVPPAVLALILGWRNSRAGERRRTGRRLSIAALALVTPVLAWLGLARALGRAGITTVKPPVGVVAHPFNLGQFLSYVWQFYLPRLPFLTLDRESPTIPIYGIWIHESAGAFGWLDVGMPTWVYPVAGYSVAVVAAWSLAILIHRRLRGIAQLLAFYLLALISLLGLLHITDYRSQIAGDGPILQGRYLLPLVGLSGLALGLIASRLSKRAQPAFVGFVLCALIGAQILSLAAVVHAYYL